MNKLTSLVCLILLCLVTAYATGPRLINYQGRLTDNFGSPENGSFDLTFSIYSTSSGGTAIWSESQSVTVTDGLFRVLLGSNTSLTEAVFADSGRWLGIAVGADPELPDRSRLVTVPWAYLANVADSAEAVTDGSIDFADMGQNGAAAGEIMKWDGSAWMASADNGGGGGSGGWVDDGSVVRLETDADRVSIGEASPAESDKLHISRSVSSTGGNHYGILTQLDWISSQTFNDSIVGIGSQTTGGNNSHTSFAVWGLNMSAGSDAVGVRGEALGSAFTNTGIFGKASAASATNAFGVYGLGRDGALAGVFGSSTSNYGVWGQAGAEGTDGVYGLTTYSSGRAVYGKALTSGAWAGYFEGDVRVTGTFDNSALTLLIDHPQKPEEMFLAHGAVASPEMKNVYDGVVVLEEGGQATVNLPEYFQTLNGDFRYQLTAIGAPGPNLFVASEIDNNRFVIAGGQPGMKVSWQVTGVRKDAYAKYRPLVVEQAKSSDDVGKYLTPTAYGKSQADRIDSNDSDQQSLEDGAVTAVR